MFKFYKSPILSLPRLCILGALATSCLSGCTLSKLEVLEHDDETRSYWIHAAEGAGANTPLVLVLHGGGDTGQDMEQQTGFSWVAQGEGFTVAYPNGLGNQWNDGRSNGPGGDTDDVGFIAAVIDDIATKYGIDPNRVFVTGVTDGGMMALRVACELSDKVAAIAPVYTSMPIDLIGQCEPVDAVSVLFVNNVDSPSNSEETIPVEEGAALWAEKNGCPAEPQSVEIPALASDGNIPVDAQIYSQCADGTEVASITVNSDGGTWPIILGLVRSQVGEQSTGLPFGGSISKEMMASQAIWEFFKLHPKQ